MLKKLFSTLTLLLLATNLYAAGGGGTSPVGNNYAFKRILTQVPVANTAYPSTGFPMVAAGHRGVSLIVQYGGTGTNSTNRLKIQVKLSPDGITPFAHEVERIVQLSPQAGSNFPAFIDCVTNGSYIIVTAETQETVPGTNPIITIDAIPLDNAPPITQSKEVYGLECNVRGTAREIYYGYYFWDSGWMSGTTASSNVVTTLMSAGGNGRIVVYEVTGCFRQISAATADATKRQFRLIYLDEDLTGLTQQASSAVRASDTVSIPSAFTIFRATTGAGVAVGTAQDGTYLASPVSWAVPNLPAINLVVPGYCETFKLSDPEGSALTLRGTTQGIGIQYLGGGTAMTADFQFQFRFKTRDEP